jgi:hypothetical protein
MAFEFAEIFISWPSMVTTLPNLWKILFVAKIFISWPSMVPPMPYFQKISLIGFDGAINANFCYQ